MRLVQPPCEKYRALSSPQISSLLRASRLMKRGVSRSSRTWRWEAMAARYRSILFRMRTNEVLRTAKPCGPGAPTLASSWRRCLRIARDDASHRTEVMSLRIAPAMVARKPGHQGEPGVSRKAIARGRPAASAQPVVPAPCIFYPHGGRGCQPASGLPCALSTEEGCLAKQNSGDTCRGNAALRLIQDDTVTRLFENGIRDCADQERSAR